MFEIKNLYKHFKKEGGGENHIINGLNLCVEKGEFVTILGNNGAGKSTLFNLISGTILSDWGSISLDGKELTFMAEHKRSKFIGRVFQSPMMGTAPHLTVAENMALAYGRQKRKHFNWAVTKELKSIFYNKLAESNMGLEDKLDSKMVDLSGGQSQVVALIMSTINPPQLLLLDEHTAALDPKTADDVMAFTKRLIKDEGLTALMITHHLDDAIDYGNRLIMLDQGIIAHDFKAAQKEALSVEKLKTFYQIREN